ncbi:MAG TPA: D-alanine--D-alanine ligase family protein [Candidatus Limnocylindrales bacterium]|nr:D-alanine--D-alanine ligase family protein [Candidatus Limnocylindrales bacterium]
MTDAEPRPPDAQALLTGASTRHTSASTPHPSASTRPPVVVLLGGPSAEHDVSVVSGTAIADALRDAGLTVSQVLIDLERGWWWLPEGHARGDRPASAYDDPAALGADGPLTLGAGLDRLAGSTPPPVVFIALHGPYGEDGTVQALLEAADLAYTGSGVLPSAIGMDKVVQKRIWQGLGLPVIESREIRLAAWQRDPGAVLGELDAFARATGEARLMVKPARLGSSVGMTLAHGPDERGPALDLAFRYDTLAVVERYLPGARDLEVSVIGTEPPLGVYGPGEIIAGHEFYDYAAKYTPGLSETSTHAELPAVLRETIRKLARDAYRAIGGEGFARVDFLLQGEAIYLSEINTIPGFTPISLFPTMPSEAGLDFEAVCLRILDLAIERQATRPASRTRLAPTDLPR